MNKILLIIQREYLTRVKKKSFIIMTIVGPILMAAIFVVPVWLATRQNEKSEILVVDESLLFINNLPNSKTIHFNFDKNLRLEQAQTLLTQTNNYQAVLYIPHNIIEGGISIKFFYKKPIGAIAESYIKDKIEEALFKWKLLKNNINPEQIAQAKTSIALITEKLTDDGHSEQTSTASNIAVGMGAAFIIYFLIFLYGAQVMRGVIEEKTNRIIEVMISSVKPFQLMMGKITGIALVGITQFLLWIVLTVGISFVAQQTILKGFNKKLDAYETAKEEVFKKGADLSALSNVQKDPDETIDFLKGLKAIDFTAIIVLFLFYFIGGYLLYSALFAAIGAAVDNEADTQQFMLPVTIPLILSFVIAQNVMQNPESTIAFWGSIIPFTSPIIMMVRLPYGVPLYEIILSVSLLAAGFIFTTWIAARIYRIGILMYGKKPTWKELGKWLFYKG
jgi:ABC-2 type transport system permease protein